MELGSRITSGIKIGGTKTFRLSSGKLLDLWGTNTQNPSEAVCKAIIPDLGKLFVQVDQAGAEALVVAYLCRKGRLRQLFDVGIKSHVYVAMHIFASHWDKMLGKPDGYVKHTYCDCPIGELRSLPEWKQLAEYIKSDKVKYYIGKKTCHAANYGMQPPRMRLEVLKETSGELVLTVTETGMFLYMYHNIFPEIKEWHRETERRLKENGVLYNLQGYPREFVYAYVDTKLLGEAYAFVPQSTVGTITNIAYTNLQNYIEDNSLDWDLLNNKHDSYLLQVPPSASIEAAALARRFMEQDLKAWDGTDFRMKSEAKWGYNWGDYEKENEKGLREYTSDELRDMVRIMECN